MRNPCLRIGLTLIAIGMAGLWIFDDHTWFALSIWVQVVGFVAAGVGLSPKHLT